MHEGAAKQQRTQSPIPHQVAADHRTHASGGDRPQDHSAREQAEVRFFAIVVLERFAAWRRRVGYDLASDVLSQVAARIVDHLPGASIARTGRASIEFVFSAGDVALGKDALEHLGRSLEQEICVEGYSFVFSATIGYVEAPKGPITDREFDRATMALNRARDNRQKVSFGDSEDLDGEIYNNLSLLRDLKVAMAQGDLKLLYQPKLEARSCSLHSVEALLRWYHAEHGLLRTDKLIEVAESTGFIRELTKWAVQQAVKEQSELGRAGHSVKVFLNLSGVLLADRSFAQWILRSFSGIEACFGLEITETAVIDDPEDAIANLQAFASAGLEIAIDDYGSGLSSLDYLKRLPASELKIDRSFIDGLTESHRDPLIVRSSIDLAHALDMKVTAEGVDDSMTLSLLRVMGCDILQGFFICKPLPADELLVRLEQGFAHVTSAQDGLALLPRAQATT